VQNNGGFIVQIDIIHSIEEGGIGQSIFTNFKTDMSIVD
jgi:hypothetical protein